MYRKGKALIIGHQISKQRCDLITEDSGGMEDVNFTTLLWYTENQIGNRIHRTKHEQLLLTEKFQYRHVNATEWHKQTKTSVRWKRAGETYGLLLFTHLRCLCTQTPG